MRYSKAMGVFFAFLSTALLASCGGGGSSTPVSQQQQANAWDCRQGPTRQIASSFFHLYTSSQCQISIVRTNQTNALAMAQIKRVKASWEICSSTAW